MIADGYDDEVDRLRTVMNDGQGWVDRVAAEEKARTGIKTLKVGYNKVFGYYIEVSKSFADQVPANYIRKQTLVERRALHHAGAEGHGSHYPGRKGQALRTGDTSCSASCGVLSQTGASASRKLPPCWQRRTCTGALRRWHRATGMSVPRLWRMTASASGTGGIPWSRQFVTDAYFVPNDTELDTPRQPPYAYHGSQYGGEIAPICGRSH